MSLRNELQQQLDKGNQQMDWRLTCMIVLSSVCAMSCWHLPEVAVYLLILQVVGLGYFIYEEHQWTPKQEALVNMIGAIDVTPPTYDDDEEPYESEELELD